MLSTLDDSHRTGTTEIVQAIKIVEDNIEDNKDMEIWDQTNVFIKKIVNTYGSEWCGNTFNCCTISDVPVPWLSSSVAHEP